MKTLHLKKNMKCPNICLNPLSLDKLSCKTSSFGFVVWKDSSSSSHIPCDGNSFHQLLENSIPEVTWGPEDVKQRGHGAKGGENTSWQTQTAVMVH